MPGGYYNVFCPTCGRKLQEGYQGTDRVGCCIRGHAWRVTATLAGYRLEEIKQPESDKAIGVEYKGLRWL